MQTITLDGVEYVLVPKEQLQPVDQPSIEATQQAPDAPKSILNDFVDQSVVPPTSKPVDDGLATQSEKENAIRVVEPTVAQSVKQAVPRPSAYRNKFVKKQLTPADVISRPQFHGELLASNPEDPMIKADAQKPKEMQLFYGPGTQYEGY